MILVFAHVRKFAKRIPFLVPMYRFVRAQVSPHERALHNAQRAWPGLLLQPSPHTKEDRYPQFFAYLRNALADVAHPQLLSFGCSVGDEVFSLRAYFPQASIVGMDINARNIAICKRRLRRTRDADVRFVCAGSTQDQPSGVYDAIFCLAVLRHGDLQVSPPDQCTPMLDFAVAERLVGDMTRCLKPGGYLIIWNSHFRFADMAVSSQFEVAFTHERGGWANSPLYGRDNHLIDVPAYCEAIFRKSAALS